MWLHGETIQLLTHQGFPFLCSLVLILQWMDPNIACNTLLEKWQGHTHQHIYPCITSNLSCLLTFIIVKNWLPFPMLIKIILLNFWTYHLFHQYVRNYRAMYLTEQVKPFKCALSWFLVTSHNMHIFSEVENAIYSLIYFFPRQVFISGSSESSMVLVCLLISLKVFLLLPKTLSLLKI